MATNHQRDVNSRKVNTQSSGCSTPARVQSYCAWTGTPAEGPGEGGGHTQAPATEEDEGALPVCSHVAASLDSSEAGWNVPCYLHKPRTQLDSGTWPNPAGRKTEWQAVCGLTVPPSLPSPSELKLRTTSPKESEGYSVPVITLKVVKIGYDFYSNERLHAVFKWWWAKPHPWNRTAWFSHEMPTTDYLLECTGF